MIPFEQIDERLKSVGKDRAWLVACCGRSENSVRAALAPNAPATKRSELLQRALSDAIEREETKSRNAVILPDRFTIEAPTEEARKWNEAAAKEGISIHEWAVRELGKAAEKWAKQQKQDRQQSLDNIVAFPEIPLLHAAAGSPATTDAETFAPTRSYGAGRFACQLHGDSMAPKYPDGSTVILRERSSLKRPIIKNGEIYLFDVAGEKTLKIYQSRVATEDEIDDGISYVSNKDGKTKVRTLRSINPEFPEIVLRGEGDWIGWLDKKDQ